MFVAKDAAGELVDIAMAMPDGVYFCPSCGAELIQRRGATRVPHFAHIGADCSAAHEPMTQWHLDWQHRFPEECREITMDSGGVRHRADVDLGRVVLEFQHSAISEQVWRERTKFYTDDYEKRVFWVYDRTNHDIRDDFFVSPVVTRHLNVLFGCDELARREFYRNMRLYGSGQPVFLDYGRFVVMFYDFLDVLQGHDNSGLDDLFGYKLPCYAKGCMLLTPDRFVELVTQLGAYPWSIMRDVDMCEHVRDNADWFLESIKLVSHDLLRSGIDTTPVVRRFGDYLVRRQKGAGLIQEIDYANRVGMSLCFSHWPYDALWFGSLDRAQWFLKWVADMCDPYESDCEYDIIRMDSSMISFEIMRYLKKSGVRL